MAVDRSKSVFISYRRSVSSHFARAIRTGLTKLGYDVFLDVENIGPGEFESVILNEIEARPHFIILMQAGGLERCAEEGDWLRRECLTARQANRNIIPVFAEDLSHQEVSPLLPEEMGFLLKNNTVSMVHDYWDAGITKLDRFLGVSVDAPLAVRTPQQKAEVERKQQLVDQTDPVTVAIDPLAEFKQSAQVLAEEAARIEREQQLRRESWDKHWQDLKDLVNHPHVTPQISRDALQALCAHFQINFPTNWKGKVENLLPIWQENQLIFAEQERDFDLGFGVTMPMCLILAGQVEGMNGVVLVDHDFWIGKYPVTQGQWTAVMGSTPSHFTESGDRAPVEQVSWEDTQTFFEKVGKGLRLPSAAEWEYACCAGTTGDFNVDGAALGDLAWFGANSDNKTHPVGEKLPNAWRLHDMHGNVWEWCQDWYDGGQDTRVLRGGSWRSVNQFALRSSYRDLGTPSSRVNYIGFRCVCDVV